MATTTFISVIFVSSIKSTVSQAGNCGTLTINCNTGSQACYTGPCFQTASLLANRNILPYRPPITIPEPQVPGITPSPTIPKPGHFPSPQPLQPIPQIPAITPSPSTPAPTTPSPTTPSPTTPAPTTPAPTTPSPTTPTPTTPAPTTTAPTDPVTTTTTTSTTTTSVTLEALCPKPGEICSNAVPREERCCNGERGGAAKCKYTAIDAGGARIGTCCIKNNKFGCMIDSDCCGGGRVCHNGQCLRGSQVDNAEVNKESVYDKVNVVDYEKGEEERFLSSKYFAMILIVMVMLMNLCMVAWCYRRYIIKVEKNIVIREDLEKGISSPYFGDESDNITLSGDDDYCDELDEMMDSDRDNDYNLGDDGRERNYSL